MSQLGWTSALAAVTAASAALNATFATWPTPFGAIDCPRAMAPDDSWVFEAARGQWHSCDMPISSRGATMCVNENGQPDPSSIFMNMADMQHGRSGCFAFTSKCSFNMRRLAYFEFDVDLRGCETVWAGPLWASPNPWTSPAKTSGEVDFVELCTVGSVRTNFGAGGEPGEQQVSWGSASGMDGPKHFVATLDPAAAGGHLRTFVSELDGSNRITGSYYLNYLNTVTATKGGNNYPFTLVSDVWNGYGGDGGWDGCQARNDPNTNCQYVIKNIRFHTNDNRPMFDWGACKAMNGNSGVASAGSNATRIADAASVFV